MSTHPIELFYSYADADESLCIELDRHLSVLQVKDLIRPWHKRLVEKGISINKSTLINNMAILHFEQEKNDQEALLYYQEALALCKEHLGPKSPLAAYVQHNMANLYREIGARDTAKNLYQEAARILSKQPEDRRYEIAHQDYGLAGLYRAEKNYEEAKKCYEQALRAWEEHLGLNHPLVAHPLYGLAELYRAEGNYKEAKECYERVLKIWRTKLGAGHLQVASPLYGLACLEEARGNEKEAEKYYQQALNLLKEILGVDHRFTQIAQRKHDHLLQMMGHNASAGGISTHEAGPPPLRCVVCTPLRGNSNLDS